MKAEVRQVPRFLARVLAILLLAAGPAGAEAPEVSFRMTRFDPSDRPPPSFRVRNKSKWIELEVPLTYIEGPIKATLRDERFLDFFRGDAGRPALSVEIAPEKRKDLLLVFVPAQDGAEETGGYRILPIHAPVSRIKGGDRYIVNATSSEVAIRYGKSNPVRIAPRKAGLVPGPGGKSIESFPVVIMQKTPQEWKLVSTEHWPHDPRFRTFLFLYKSPRTGHIAFHGVTERL